MDALLCHDVKKRLVTQGELRTSALNTARQMTSDPVLERLNGQGSVMPEDEAGARGPNRV